MGEKYTPGPWFATNHFANDATPCNCAYVLSEGYAGSICDISVGNGLAIGDGGNDAPPRDEAAANALLIAAAPDMLADLIEAERMFRWYGDMHAAKPDMDKAQRNHAMADRLAATIAKATPTDTKPAGEGEGA